MLDRGQPNQEFILGFLCAIALSAIVAACSQTETMIHSLWSQEAAGWAQAIGTVLAIFGAVKIADRQFRKSEHAAHIREVRKAKSLILFVGPFLKVLNSETDRLIDFCEQNKNIGLTTPFKLHLGTVTFRSLPGRDYVLNNAHTLPGDVAADLSQLIAFRDIIAEALYVIIKKSRATKTIAPTELESLLEWLKLMKGLIAEILEKLPEIHDQPIAKILDTQ